MTSIKDLINKAEVRRNYVFRFSEAKHAKFRQYCVKQDISMSDLLNHFVDKILEADTNKKSEQS